MIFLHVSQNPVRACNGEESNARRDDGKKSACKVRDDLSAFGSGLNMWIPTILKTIKTYIKPNNKQNIWIRVIVLGICADDHVIVSPYIHLVGRPLQNQNEQLENTIANEIKLHVGEKTQQFPGRLYVTKKK